MNSPHTIFSYVEQRLEDIRGMTYSEEEQLEKRIQDMRDAVHDALTIDCKKIPECILDHSWEFMEAVVGIMSDRDDDKEGRINDVWKGHVDKYCKWLLGQPGYARDREFEFLGIDAAYGRCDE